MFPYFKLFWCLITKFQQVYCAFGIRGFLSKILLWRIDITLEIISIFRMIYLAFLSFQRYGFVLGTKVFFLFVIQVHFSVNVIFWVHFFFITLLLVGLINETDKFFVLFELFMVLFFCLSQGFFEFFTLINELMDLIFQILVFLFHFQHFDFHKLGLSKIFLFVSVTIFTLMGRFWFDLEIVTESVRAMVGLSIDGIEMDWFGVDGLLTDVDQFFLFLHDLILPGDKFQIDGSLFPQPNVKSSVLYS